MASFAEWVEQEKKKKKKEELTKQERIAGGEQHPAAGLSFSDYAKQVLGRDDFDDPADIAPVKKTTESDDKEKWYEGWFQKGATEDGATIGNIAKSGYASTVDINENVATGVIGSGEKLVDAGLMLGAAGAEQQMKNTALEAALFDRWFGGIADWFKGFSSDYASVKKEPEKEKTKEEKFNETLHTYDDVIAEMKAGTEEAVAKDLYDEKKIAQAIISGLPEKITGINVEEDSFLANKTDSLAQSAGQMGVTVGLNALAPGMGTAFMFGTAFGAESENALREGATYDEALVSSYVSALGEVLTEQLSGGIRLPGVGTLDDLLTKQISQKITNKYVSAVLQFGLDAFGEGAEEWIAEDIGAFGRWMTYQSEEELKNLLWSEDALNAKIEAFIGGAALGGSSNVVKGTKSVISSKLNSNKLNENEQKVADAVTEARIAEEEKGGKKLTNKQKADIEAQVREDLEKGRIDTDTIESVLGMRDGDNYKSYTDTLASEEAIVNEYNELADIPENELSRNQRKRLDELEGQIEDAKAKTGSKQFKQQYDEEVSGIVKNSRFLTESYNEKARRGQAFEVDLSQYEGKEKEILQGFMDKGQINNTNQAKDFWLYAAKVGAEKGLNITSTTTEEIIEMETKKHGKEYVERVFADGVVPNAYIMEDGTLAINVKSVEARRTILGHEITHTMEKGAQYEAMQNFLFAYAEGKMGTEAFQKRLATVEEMYKDVEGANAKNELTADLVGEYLYGDPDFVRHLSTQNQNLFQKIWSEIKYLYKMATAGSQEARELEKIKRMFEQEYRNSGKVSGDSKFSLSSMGTTFFGNESAPADAFAEGSYKQAPGYQAYVNECLNNYKQTRGDSFDEAVARKEIEDSIDGIVRVALAAKRAGYDIFDDGIKRNKRDSKNRLLFSSLEPNSDYFTSSDISTICDKRQNFADIYDEIVRAEEAKGVPQGKRFFDNINNYFYLHGILAEKGLTQPCRECYVESMRKNLAPMANAFLRLVNETDANNTANDQLYQQKGKNKGALKTNNAALRERVLDILAENGMSSSDLTVETLTTEDGLAQLRIQAPLVYEAFNSFYGQSKPKMPKSATPFRFGELTALLTDEHGKIKQSLVDKINATGGFRLQSYSDFQIQNYTDVLQTIFEAGTLGLSGHAYTKVPAFLEATEGTNLKRNISIFMYKDGNEWKLDRNDSFPYTLEEIYDIVKADKTGNTSIIAVSQNEDMSAWIMANDNIGYFIPFHKSGLKMATVRDTIVREDGREIKGYTGTKDHTRQQAEVWATTTADHKALTNVKKGINIYEFWDFANEDNLSKNELIEKNVKRYIDECEKAGYLPKFREYVMNNGKVLNSTLAYAKELGFVSQDATIEDISFEYKGYTIPYGYYKCLGDFGMFTPDGKASSHDVLSLNNYDFDKAEQFFADAETLRRNEILQQFANDGERQRYADSDLTAGELADIIKQKRAGVVEDVMSRYGAPTQYSLSRQGDTHRYGRGDGAMSETALVRDDVAPVQGSVQDSVQDVAPVAPTVNQEIDRMIDAVTDKEFAYLGYDPNAQPETDEEAKRRLSHISDMDAPPEMDAPYYGEESQPMTADDPFESRQWWQIDRNTKAFTYENPDARPFFAAEADVMLGDLSLTQPAERWYNDKLYYDTNGEKGFFGVKRHTSSEIASLLDDYGFTYAQIEEGLNAIIEGNSKVNNKAAKHIEAIINDRLLKGYKDFYSGEYVPPNQGYIEWLNGRQNAAEYAEGAATLTDADAPPAAEDYAPVVEAPTMADTLTVEDVMPIAEAPVAEQYEAIKPKAEAEPRMARATPEEQATAQVMTEEPKVKAKKPGAWSWVKEHILDRGMVFEDLALKTGNRELQARWNSIRRAEGIAQKLVGEGNAQVRSLKSMQEGIEKSGKTQHFYEYLYHLHNVDRMTLAERYDGVENKTVFGDAVTADVSRDAAAKLEKANPEFKQYAKDVYAYNTYLRELLVDGGVISRETAKLWEEMYPHYVPIRRAGDKGININVPLDSGRTGINAPIKRATGGNSDILPLFDTMAMRTMQTYKAIAKNRFGVELKNTLGTVIENDASSLDEVIDSIDTQEELLQEGKNGQSPTFTVFDNGERVKFEITEEMYEAMKPSNFGYTNKTVNTISNIRRGTLTEYNPWFLLKNAVKDVQDVLINSQHPVRTYAAIPKAIGQMATKGHWYQEYMDNGGDQNTYFDNDTGTFAKENKALETAKKVFGLNAISKANNIVERLPRLAEYIASREAGQSVDVSMLDAARVTTNFAAGGDLTRMLNRNGFTFLNASVQGAVQQARNIREAKRNGLKGWAGLAAKYIAAGLPALLLNGLIWDDDDEYAELSDYVKQNYYIVGKYGDGKFVRIPKGRAVAVIQNGFEQMGNLVTGNDEVDLKTFLDLVVENLAPSNPAENNILAPIFDVMNNETWYGEDLVPTRLQDVPAAEQYDESTDSISRWLGEATNSSPYKWNYLLDQYTGVIGDTFLPMLTPEAENGEDSIGGELIAPLKDMFTTDSVLKNQNVSDFYDTVDELTANANSSGATDEDVLQYKYINSVNSEMGELYKAKREIQNSDLSDAEKYEQVRDIQKQIDELAKEGLDTYGGVSIQGKYATVGDRHYKWYEPGEDSEAEPGWQKITDKQLEKQNNVTSSLGISPSDYWSNKEEYDYAYDNPGKYAVAKSVGGYNAYKGYSKELYDIKADKDENGKSISGSRKEKVIEYINNLDADYGERIILFKSEYNADDTYNYEIIEYLNGRDDISYEEMEVILKELGFTVKPDGTITWD